MERDEEQAAGAPDETSGARIGRYKLLRRIGEGGFGTVWMAEQEEPVRRRVALKVIRRGMDSKQIVARFEAERQALALMDHPYIAKVLDGGETPGGRPFFVMELVDGVPITQFCDTHRLDIRARLELFREVCSAVQHAHQKAVIHRDLKPSNILVTEHGGAPVPKVIDFGVAKATSAELTRKTMFTELRQLIGTPEYMAPEQAELSSLGVDTRADVYSLGVLLYELLTGTRPFDLSAALERGYSEMLRVIKEEDPPRPSLRIGSLGGQAMGVAKRRRIQPDKLGRTVRGDLDWIVMRALEKERTRRYETCEAFSMDIKRHLDDEPVLASPPGARYRLRKLIKRNKGTFIAGTVVLVVLVLGAAGTAIGLLRAVAAEERAQVAAANAGFHLRFTRDEAARTVNELAGVVRKSRRLQAISHFVDEHDRSRYPDEELIDFDERLERLFPELGPTTVDSVDRGVERPAPVAALLATHFEEPGSPSNAPLDEWARENRERLRSLVELIHEGDPVVTLGWRPGSPLWQAYLPSLGARRQAVAILGAHAIAHHLDGNHDLAVDALRAGRRLSRATGSSGHVITALADAQSRRILYSLVRWMIVDTLRRGEHPDASIQFVIEDAPLPSREAEIRYEMRAARQVAGELFQVRERDGLPRADREVWRDLAEYYADPPDLVEIERFELDATLDAIEAATEVYLDLVHAHGLEMISEEPPEAEALARPEVASFLIPHMTNAFRRWEDARRQRDATIITAALAARRHREGVWPEDIDTALAGFPVRPLRRDYFGRDFIYRVEDGGPFLYGVGPNKLDDGGDGAGTPPLDEVFVRPPE